jgi:hypothetical protein
LEERPASVGDRPPAPPAVGWRTWLALNASTGALLAAILLVGMGAELWSPLMPEYLKDLEAPILLIALYGSTKDLLEAVNFYLGGVLAGRFNTRRALLLFNGTETRAFALNCCRLSRRKAWRFPGVMEEPLPVVTKLQRAAV